MVDDGFRRFCHRFLENVLMRHVFPHFHHILGLSGGMDICLSGRRGDADGDVLQRPSESCHRMSLEMGKYHHEVIVQEIFPYIIRFQVFTSFYRKCRLAFRVHDVHRGYGGETMVDGCFQVIFRVVTSTAVGSVAFHYRAVHFLHQRFDEIRIEVVVVARLAGG